jgi:ATP-dependent protease ClpP protease subunit
MANNTFKASDFTGNVTIRGGGTISLLVGSDSTGNTLTDATEKRGRLATPHYTNSEEPLAIFYAKAGETSNEVYIGGGASNMNVATAIGFITAADNTTTTGSARLTINSAGLVRVYQNLQVDGDVAVNGGDITSSASTFNLVNATSTTVNFAGAATALTMGASASGTTSIRNKLRVGSKTDTATTGTIDTAGVSVIYLNPGSPYNLTTLSNGAAGDVVTLVNVSANTVTIKDGTGNIQCGADVSLAAKGARMLVYSAASSEWLMIGNNSN